MTRTNGLNNMNNAISLAIVVPCYNEEAVLEQTIGALQNQLQQLILKQKINQASKLYFVDDGSRDNTWQMLSQAAAEHEQVTAIKLSINKGHQNALYAGLISTSEDAVVSIDADLQDDPALIESMVDQFQAGYDVVYGVRSSRATDSFMKRVSAEKYYKFMLWLGIDLVYNHADFRLMSRAALNALKEYPESNLFLRGLVRKIGFQSTIVEYERAERQAGETKYPLRKMLSFAWEGLSSFSVVPLRAITILGFVASWLSVFVLMWVLGIRLFTEDAVPGWASILLPLLFFGSIQLLSLGIIGEYIAKIYNEVKRRPRFHIEKVITSTAQAAQPTDD